MNKKVKLIFYILLIPLIGIILWFSTSATIISLFFDDYMPAPLNIIIAVFSSIFSFFIVRLLFTKQNLFNKENVIILILSTLLVVILLFLTPIIIPIVKINTSPVLDYDDINFSIKEVFSEKFDGPHSLISFYTEKQYGCSNFNLATFSYQLGNKIYVYLRSVVRHSTCLTSFGPASDSNEFKLKEGTYIFNLIRKSKKDIYEISVTDDEIDIKPLSEPRFSKIGYQKVLRVPKNLIWAECSYNGNIVNYYDTLEYCSNFHQELEKLTSSKNNKFETIHLKKFYMFYDDDQKLFDLVKKFNRKDFGINIQTWKGKFFYCQADLCEVTTAEVPEELGPRLF